MFKDYHFFIEDHLMIFPIHSRARNGARRNGDATNGHKHSL
jgi:hypothetical protein